MDHYQQKYLKYKKKYLELKKSLDLIKLKGAALMNVANTEPGRCYSYLPNNSDIPIYLGKRYSLDEEELWHIGKGHQIYSYEFQAGNISRYDHIQGLIEVECPPAGSIPIEDCVDGRCYKLVKNERGDSVDEYLGKYSGIGKKIDGTPGHIIFEQRRTDYSNNRRWYVIEVPCVA
jgi:hypothetical protein